MKYHLLLAVIVLLWNAPDGLSQPSHAEDILERIHQLKKVRMIEMLDLAEEQSVRFFARLHEYERETEGLKHEKEAALEKIERLVRNRADSTEFGEVFSQALSLDEKLVELDRRFFQSLQGILTVEQQGKYLLFNRQFERELRESLKEIQRRRQNLKE